MPKNCSSLKSGPMWKSMTATWSKTVQQWVWQSYISLKLLNLYRGSYLNNEQFLGHCILDYISAFPFSNQNWHRKLVISGQIFCESSASYFRNWLLDPMSKLKFIYSEKSTNIWQNLVKFYWPSQNSRGRAYELYLQTIQVCIV